jgi:ribosomal protein L31E
MATEEGEQEQVTIAVPLRRLLTGVSRTQKAPSAIPRVKRFVLRHIDSEWRDAIWDERRGQHRVWIDDFLNKTIWSRGREHVGGPQEWIAGKDGGRPRLATRTTARYGSVLKVKALFVEEPRDGGEPRLEVYLYGYGDKEREEAERKAEEADREEEPEEAEVPAPAQKKAKEAPAKEAPVKEAPAKEAPAKPAPGKEMKPPVSKSAAAKPAKPTETLKGEPKKAAAKPKKEGGD